MPSGDNMFYVDQEAGHNYSGEFIGKELVEITRKMFPLSSALFTEGIEKRTDDNPFFAETRTFAQCVFGNLEKVKNSDKDPKWLVRNNLEKGKPFPKIYMTCGKQDFLFQLNKEFYNYLIQNGVTVEYVEDEGSHEWDFWNRAIKRVIDWLR